MKKINKNSVGWSKLGLKIKTEKTKKPKKLTEFFKNLKPKTEFFKKPKIWCLKTEITENSVRLFGFEY